MSNLLDQVIDFLRRKGYEVLPASKGFWAIGDTPTHAGVYADEHVIACAMRQSDAAHVLDEPPAHTELHSLRDAGRKMRADVAAITGPDATAARFVAEMRRAYERVHPEDVGPTAMVSVYFDVPPVAASAIRRAMRPEAYGDRFDVEQVCRVCGCTDDFGCDEGCAWVAEDLCSRCALVVDRAGGAAG